jgi:hypothetical protein
MDVSVYIRRSTLAALYGDVVRDALTQSLAFEPVRGPIVAATGAFISGVVLQGVTLYEDQSLTDEYIVAGVWVPRFVSMRVDFIMYVSHGTGASSDIRGGLANTAALGVRVIFKVSMSQPGAVDMPRPPGVLLLKADVAADRRVIEIQGRGSVAWEQLFGNARVAWFDAVVGAVEKIQVGALTPPLNAATVDAVVEGASSLIRNVARVVDDEVHFASVFEFALPRPMLFRALTAFNLLGPQLSASEDCAVVLGETATLSLFYNLAHAVGDFLFNNSGAVFGSQTAVRNLGWMARGRPLFAVPPQTSIAEDGAFRTELPFSMTGVCRGIDTPVFPGVEMGLDLSLNTQLSLTDTAGVSINAVITIDADLDQDGVSRCFAEVLIIENWAGLVFWPIGIAVADTNIESTIVSSLFEDGGSLLQRQLDRVGATFSRAGDESIRVSAAVRVGFDSFGAYSYNMDSIRSAKDGFRYRISGSLPHRFSSGDITSVLLEAREVEPYFPLSFSSTSSLQGVSCDTRALPSIGFVLWNRSPREALIYNLDIRSPDWELLFDSGGARWTPRASRQQPVAIPPWGARRFRFVFSSLERLDEVLGFAVAGSAFAGLSLLVLSNGPPIWVHWEDPLRRLRNPTADEIASARDLCARGPVMSPSDPLFRARDFNLFLENEPDWQRDGFSELSSKFDDSTALHGRKSDGFRSNGLNESGQSVFSVLLQSMKHRR